MYDDIFQIIPWIMAGVVAMTFGDEFVVLAKYSLKRRWSKNRVLAEIAKQPPPVATQSASKVQPSPHDPEC